MSTEKQEIVACYLMSLRCADRWVFLPFGTSQSSCFPLFLDLILIKSEQSYESVTINIIGWVKRSVGTSLYIGLGIMLWFSSDV